MSHEALHPAEEPLHRVCGHIHILCVTLCELPLPVDDTVMVVVGAGVEEVIALVT